jgi:hypothetical protein
MTTQEEEVFSDDDRQLCADGACTGLIGDDGACKVCRRPAGLAAQPGDPPPSEAPAHFRGEDEDADVIGGFDPGRRLCSDGACTGVLDSSGKCKECGKLDSADSPS